MSLPGGTGTSRSAWLPGLLLFSSAAVVAFLLYHPETDAPFEIIDFSETLPFLTDGRDFGERFHGLVGYYLQHGRAAFALSAGLAAKWTLFEWWTPGWQWTRFVVGLTVVVLAFYVLRALGANRTGSAIGASLFVVSETAAPGWLRPAVNEPFGTVVLLSAALLACRYQASTRPTRLAVIIALLLGFMIVVKETLVAAVFLPVALAVCRGPDGLLRMPERSRRNAVLLVASVVAIALAAIPVLWALTKTAPEGYARQFGASGSMVSNAIFGLLPALFPFAPVSQPMGFAALVDAMWLVLLLMGLRGLGRDTAMRQHVRIVLLLALALPAARAMVYMPWPIQFPYYSFPYLFGVAIILALSITGATKASGLQRRATLVAATLVLLYAAAGAFTSASRYFAVRRLTDHLVTGLHAESERERAQRFVVAVPRLTIQDWWGLAPTLERFARATARTIPPGRDMLCDDVKTMLTARPDSTTLVAAIRWQCSLGAGVRTVHSVATRVGRPNLRPVHDSLFADYRTVSATRAGVP